MRRFDPQTVKVHEWNVSDRINPEREREFLMTYVPES